MAHGAFAFFSVISVEAMALKYFVNLCSKTSLGTPLSSSDTKKITRLQKILLLTGENKMHIFKLPCRFLFLYRHSVKKCTKAWNMGNDLVDVLIGENVENTPVGHMNLRADMHGIER